MWHHPPRYHRYRWHWSECRPALAPPQAPRRTRPVTPRRVLRSVAYAWFSPHAALAHLVYVFTSYSPQITFLAVAGSRRYARQPPRASGYLDSAMAFNCELEALSLRSYILRDESLARLSTLGAKGTRAAPARLMRSLAFPQLRETVA